MKKFTVMVFALAALGITACSSVPKKLDFSTLDLSKPIAVKSISLYVYAADFYRVHGNSLKNPAAKLEKAETDKLLQILCGTAARNWESIVQRVKAETGVTLDGSLFLQDLKNGDSTRINSQEVGISYFYTWDNPTVYEPGTVDDERVTFATISLTCRRLNNSLVIIPSYARINRLGEMEEDGLTQHVSESYLVDLNPSL